jgi:hypothetical protein
MGTPFLLFVVFLVLKLTHTIDWSWFFVFLPLALEAVIDGLILLITLLAAVYASGRAWKGGKL